jgi:hypothetical protein
MPTSQLKKRFDSTVRNKLAKYFLRFPKLTEGELWKKYLEDLKTKGRNWNIQKHCRKFKKLFKHLKPVQRLVDTGLIIKTSLTTTRSIKYNKPEAYASATWSTG